MIGCDKHALLATPSSSFSCSDKRVCSDETGARLSYNAYHMIGQLKTVVCAKAAQLLVLIKQLR
jgi:hypothetical protein